MGQCQRLYFKVPPVRCYQCFRVVWVYVRFLNRWLQHSPIQFFLLQVQHQHYFQVRNFNKEKKNCCILKMKKKNLFPKSGSTEAVGSLFSSLIGSGRVNRENQRTFNNQLQWVEVEWFPVIFENIIKNESLNTFSDHKFNIIMVEQPHQTLVQTHQMQTHRNHLQVKHNSLNLKLENK